MSMTKRIIEEASYNEGLVSSLQLLEELDYFTHQNVTKGIIRKVIADKSLNRLSGRQLHVFQAYVEPVLKRPCEECRCHINMQFVEDALSHESGSDRYLCSSCIDQRERYR